MIIGGHARYPGVARLLYAGTATSGAAEALTPGPGTVVNDPGSAQGWASISDEARAASTGSRDAGAALPNDLKARVDALFEGARNRGSFISFDSAKGGEWMDLSSFTDDELTRITNDRDGDYPQELSDYAGGALGQRLKTTLEPYERSAGVGDRRGQTMAIDKLWRQMSPDLRAALGWTPAMMLSNDSMLKGDTRLFGPLGDDSVSAGLTAAAARGGLGFSASLDRASSMLVYNRDG